MATPSPLFHLTRKFIHRREKMNKTMLKEYEGKKLEYTYIARVTNLAGSGQIDAPIQISEDADFIVTEVSRTRTGIFQIKIHDSTEDREWMNDFVSDDNFFGSLGSTQSLMPRPLPRPRRCSKNSTLRITIKDTSTSTNTIEVALHGFKLYPK
jgi:hypothetical protein